MTVGRIHRDDLAFARALAAGEPPVVLEFERRYRSTARHAVAKALRRWRPDTPVEPEDLVQDFVGFLFSDGGRRLRTYQGRSSFNAWLYTVALRFFQRQLSRHARDQRVKCEVLALLPEQGDSPEFHAIATQRAARLRASVATLSETDQLYVRLFFVEGLNASEVARTLGKGTSAVRMRKMRILERLRGHLKEGDE